MKRVFISGAYTLGDVAQNVKAAMETANQLIQSGFAPYCPHLHHFMHMNSPQPYDKWLEIDNAFLITCDAVLRIPGESSGADKEVQLAIENGIPVFYDINDINFLTLKQ